MTDKQEAAIRQIVRHYTYDQQRDMTVEECAEFIQAVCKCKRARGEHSRTSRRRLPTF